MYVRRANSGPKSGNLYVDFNSIRYAVRAVLILEQCDQKLQPYFVTREDRARYFAHVVPEERIIRVPETERDADETAIMLALEHRGYFLSQFDFAKYNGKIIGLNQQWFDEHRVMFCFFDNDIHIFP